MADWNSDERLLAHVVGSADRAGLEVILIGNAAAVLHGAPVTTQDLDFFFRETPRNLQKLAVMAQELDVIITQPALPASNVRRLVGLPVDVDLLSHLSGGLRFESVRSRAVVKRVGAQAVCVASLDDLILTKRAAGRPKDLLVLPALENTRRVLAALEETDDAPPDQS